MVVVEVYGYTIEPGAHLVGANLEGADLEGANLERANLNSALADRKTRLPEGFDSIAAGVTFE